MGNDNWQRRSIRSQFRQNNIMRRQPKTKKPLFIWAIVALVLAYFFVYKPFKLFNVRGKALQQSARQLKKDFSKNDLDLVKKDLNDFSTKYAALEKEARPLYLFSFIPYISDLKNGLEAGSYMIVAGKESVTAIEPYADLIGFKKGKGSFSEKSAEDRLQTAVLTLDKIVTHIDPISENLRQAEIRLEKIDPNRYPKNFFGMKPQDKVANLRNSALGVTTLFVDAKPLLRKLPDILGKDKKQTYLLLFQNDKERRATGGFLTSYAIFTIDKGRIKKQESDDIYQLDNSISSHPPAPREILTYHKGVSQLYIRDSNLSPDFVKSVELFNQLYEKSPRKVKYDGLIAIDSKVLVDMLTVFGDTEAGGIIFSAKTDQHCDCPQVLYTLFDVVDRPVNYVKEDRKGILGQLMQALLLKVLGFSPSRYWGPFMQNSLDNLATKHILIYFPDSGLQQAVEKLNYAGRIQDFDGDYLHVNNVNFAGAKSNLFVNETLVSKTTFSGGGVERDVTVDYRNPYPGSDCNLERGGLCLNATLRDWVRVYVPKGSKLVKFVGSQKPVKTYDDLGKTVFEGFLQVNPLGKARIEVQYTLLSSISSNNYRLLIQKQPGVETMKVEVQINNKTQFNEQLKKDIVVKEN